MTGISLEVIVRAIFGGRDQQTVDEMLNASRTMVQRSASVIFFSRRLQFRFGGLSPWDRYQAARQRLFSLLTREQQRVAAANASGQPKGEDILSCLYDAMQANPGDRRENDLNAELATLLFAGHETSAIGLSWAVYYLLSNPDVLERMRSEITASDGTPDALARLPYLKAVVQETLRIAPIVTEVLRLLLKPLQLDRYTIPAGYALAPAAAIAHFDPETFPAPDAFRPERFLERSFSPFEYMPFGGGHRRCVGAPFASYEMAVVLGTLFVEWDWELLEKGPVKPRRRNVVMGPSTPIRVQAKPRGS
jgi:cytochrome P450